MLANPTSGIKTAIIIPARYHSTRLPGKPLAMIAGKSMLQRVVELSNAAAKDMPQVQIIVATDDERILAHCETLGVNALLTPEDLPSGTDRVAFTVNSLKDKPDFIINMQGDAPFTPPDFLQALIQAFTEHPCDAVTPVAQLTWAQLDKLRTNKQSTPFSGTTAIFNPTNGHAYWFSKQILPAIRHEPKLRQQHDKSPVFRHIGLYGYSAAMLARYITLSESRFEQLEGLEQLRMIEHGFTIRCIPVDYRDRANMSGIDSLEDIARAEALIQHHGEPIY
jgi:3-deoxy-manno-octulosonate cytidylyltransferase (CMP-KDO synthetase)